MHPMQLSVTVEISAVRFRSLNSFEWAILSVLERFGDRLPSLEEISERLRIHEPGFLSPSLITMTEINAVALTTDESSGLDLPSFSLTESGRAILLEDGWEDGREEVISQQLTIEWPSGRIVRDTERRQAGQNQEQETPSIDDLQERLSIDVVEKWVNSESPTVWRVKGCFVTNIDGI